MKKTVAFLLITVIVSMTFLSGCSASVVSSSAPVSENSDSSVVSSFAPVSENESSYSYSNTYDDEYVTFPSEVKKYESYVRRRSDWTYVDSDYLKRYARLPAPSCIFGCTYGYGDDRGVAYSMGDWNCIIAYFCLLKSQDFEYEEYDSGSKGTLYTIFDDDGNIVTRCFMSEISSGPVLLITSSE